MDNTDKIIANEGGLVNNPSDKGGITKYGITKSTLSWYRGKSVSDDDIKNLSIEEAKAIYSKRFIEGPGFDKIPESMLKSNLIDFGVMSGPALAILNLQDILQVPSDGVIGPQTLTALSKANLTNVNNLLVKKRVLMCGRLCTKDPSQLQFLNGWLNRILGFLQ